MMDMRDLLRFGVGCALSCVLGCTSAGSQAAGASTTPEAPKIGSALVTNASRVTRCAEEDNVYVKLSGEALTGMRIEARQPSYIAQLSADTSAADFSDCHFSDAENPVYHFEPKRVVLWENDSWLLLGITYATFWRPNEVPVAVGGTVTEKLHLLQLHKKDPSESSSGKHESLVMYPPDGYWRAKPIPAQPLPSSVYGTSFIVGPVSEAARPFVNIQRVEFVPATLSFELSYEDGSHGRMQLLELSREKLVLQYTQDRARAAAQPLAAIRSMYVTDIKADVAEVSLRGTPEASPTVTQISDFKEARASEVAFGRSVISKHNPSAPDMWFGEFTLTAGAETR
jgi:hypothetical protein